MIKFYYSLCIIILFNLIFTLPRFAVKNGSSCIACHVNPTGSGLRNDYGSNVVALDELSFKWGLNKGNEDWDGFITEHLQIGGDFRLQGIQYNDSDSTQKKAFFPMQADFYSHLKINNNASIFSKIGIRGRDKLNAEYWILLKNIFNKIWLRIGRALPDYGLRVDDHTSFIRGGNYSRTILGLEKEGLLFGPYFQAPSMVELGGSLMLNRLQWRSSLNTPFINESTNIDENLINITTKISYANEIISIKYLIGMSHMNEENVNLMGLFAGLSYNDFTWTFETDKIKNWIDDGKISLAAYNEIAWEIIQGIQLIGKYDFFDPKTKLADGAISRYTFGMELYPLNIMEIKLQSRMSRIDSDNAITPKPEYLIQTHFWF